MIPIACMGYVHQEKLTIHQIHRTTYTEVVVNNFLPLSSSPQTFIRLHPFINTNEDKQTVIVSTMSIGSWQSRVRVGRSEGNKPITNIDLLPDRLMGVLACWSGFR